MQIEQWPLEKLIHYANNPRKNDQAVEQVAAAIHAFGFRVPIIAKSDGTIVDGHLRAKAAAKLKLKTVPVVIADDMTDTQIKAFRLSVNRMAELAEWDNELLKLELDDLKLEDFDLELTGFDDDFLKDLEPKPEGLTDPDDVPDLKPDPKSKLGDVWMLGNHRVKCGDSTDAASVAILMNGKKADLCFTSPPYNSKNGGYKTDYHGKTNSFYNHNCDDRTQEEWVEFCVKILKIIKDNLKSDMSPVVWNVMYTAHCRSGYGYSLFNKEHGLTVKETICWDKGAGFPTASKGILSRNWELVFVLSGGEKYFTTQGTNEPRWAKWDIPRPKQQEEHKATFPVDLAIKAIEDFSDSGIVIEPFLGSGSTLIACEKTGRHCYGMELSPQYVDVIIRRFQSFTGKKAIREDGVPFDSL
jgi:DNA modification methylase